MRPDENGHTPVLLDEVMHALDPRPDGIYVDCTFGRGGHSRAILGRLGPQGSLLVFDQDADAIGVALELARNDARVSCMHASFVTLEKELQARGVAGRVDGVVLDSGVSSPQLEDAGRGFSFLHDGALDMRMNTLTGLSAAEWIAQADRREIEHVLRLYGEERFARRIANAIVTYRLSKPVTRTLQLAEIVSAAVPTREPGKHPATRTFQAIRIHVNDEVGALRVVLPQIVRVLRPGGRMAVISFHSLEDREVKRFLRRQAAGDEYPPEIPVPAAAMRPVMRIIGRAIRPAQDELARNRRARSAVLRVGEKLAA
jgi:16S rRNA (cytosine1402-N4)-methyltransferase